MKQSKKMMLVWLLVLVVLAVGWLMGRGASEGLEDSDRVGREKVVAVKAEDADEWLERDGVFILDVHTPEQQHLAGTDAFIPYDQVAENVNKLPEDKGVPILVYCRSGSMSKIAAEKLVEMGYRKVFDLVGGVQAYRESHAGVLIKPERVDLGEVDYVKGAELEFRLVNNTPTELTVTRLTGSCSCTIPSMEEMTVGVYEEVPVKVAFVPSVHGDDSDLGDLTRQIYIETDNPNFKNLSAEFTAIVKRK